MRIPRHQISCFFRGFYFSCLLNPCRKRGVISWRIPTAKWKIWEFQRLLYSCSKKDVIFFVLGITSAKMSTNLRILYIFFVCPGGVPLISVIAHFITSKLIWWILEVYFIFVNNITYLRIKNRNKVNDWPWRWFIWNMNIMTFVDSILVKITDDPRAWQKVFQS